MFGYIRPCKGEMLVKNYELYKSVYCGLCKQLGKDYGVFARLILSYDSTFFALVSAGLNRDNCTTKITRKCCTCNPLKKCNYCSFSDNSLEAAAAFSIISFYYKLADTIEDENFFKAIFSKFLKVLIHSKKKKAERKFPLYDKIVSQMLKRQFEAEKNPECSIDRAADPTAKMLSQLMETLAENEDEKDIYCNFGYFLGRWVYIIDAIDDFEKDRKSGSFNAIVTKFKDNNEISFENDEFKNYCNGLLNQTMARLVEAYNLMEISKFKDIIDNIINIGMPEMQRKIIFDRMANHKKL